jgi:signal transduction histidine kinase
MLTDSNNRLSETEYPMPTWLSEALEKTNYFIPHGHCYLWIPSLLWLHVISDTLIGIAYVGISLILYLLVRKIRLPFSPVFVAFGLFIGLCGLTHFMAVWTVWNPDYWLDGLIKAATAAASVATAIGLFFIRPQVEEMVHAARLSEERRVRLETAHAELEALYEKVKEQDELKTQFFANVSHELRTPLALILGPAEQLSADPGLTDKQKRQLRSISRNGKSLLKQVNDLLDVARLEEGELQPQYTRLDLVPWFHRLTSQFEVAAESRSIHYDISAPEALQAEVDADMLERILINLLSNAFKFTPQGGDIRAELQAEGESFYIRVSDSGPGVAPEQRETVFERFRQGDGGTTRQHGGTGLGLAIAKDFVQLHEGGIELASAEEGGAQFTVHLPLRAPHKAEVATAASPVSPEAQVALEAATAELETSPEDTALEQIAGRPSVLIVEDTPDLNRFIASTLSDDYNVVTAEDGQQGLEEAIALQPDVIITDIMMPRMSGDQLVAELRARREFDATPVLLLTAKADDELRVRLLQQGAQDYLVKPFLPKELAARVKNLVTIKKTGDTLRSALASASNDVETLAHEIVLRHRQLEVAMETVEVAREQAEKASQVKTHFLAMISHEMRRPLANISMNAQLLERAAAELDPGLEKPVARVSRSSQQLSTLIEGLLEYTRMESGKLIAHLELVDTVELAKEVIETVQLEVISPEVQLRLEPPTDQLDPFKTDRRLLRIILNNLLSNALKFTYEGTVTLRLGAEGDWHIFEVQDSGIGIEEADIPRIFEPFEQLEPVQRKTIPGVGLGLSLTKEIVESLGGKITVTSEKDIGSTFTVWLSNRVDPVA